MAKLTQSKLDRVRIVECFTSASNWNDDKMDFKFYSKLKYRLLDGNEDTIAVITDRQFKASRLDPSFGSVYQEGSSLVQRGRV